VVWSIAVASRLKGGGSANNLAATCAEAQARTQGRDSCGCSPLQAVENMRPGSSVRLRGRGFEQRAPEQVVHFHPQTLIPEAAFAAFHADYGCDVNFAHS